MTETYIINYAMANLNDTIKGLNNGLYEVRHWGYEDGGIPFYTVEHRGSWESCIAYLAHEVEARELNRW